MRSLLFLAIFLLANTFAFAEGSKELWVDLPNHNTFLQLCSDFENNCYSSGNRTHFAVYGCEEEDRLNLVIKTSQEVVYLGFSGSPENGWGENAKIVYQIRDINENIVKPETDLPISGTGFISNISQARTGPQQIAGAGGYDAIVWTPPAPGTYYIEFDRVDENTENRVPGTFHINLIDVTVADSLTDEIETGRLYSKGWQLREGGGWNVNSSTFYVYSKDSIITSVTYDRMEGRAWLMFCNQTGCANTGNFEQDRKSLFQEQAYVPQYDIFLNPPDTNIFIPATTTGSIVGTPWGEAFCDSGEIIFHVEVNRAGNVEILLDFANPYIDLPLTANVEKGENEIIWSGYDANGTAVPNGTEIIFEVKYLNGLTHLPLYDIEENDHGFTIGLYAPIPPSGNTIPEVFWDDSNIPNGTTEFLGCQSPPGCHEWPVGNEWGDLNTINTWWYSASISTVPVTIFEERAPELLVFNQPPQTMCGGTYDNYFSVDADPNTEVYHWSYTGTGAIVNHADPADNFVTVDFAPDATAGELQVYGTNSNCTDPGPTNSLTINVGPVPDAAFSFMPNDTVCVYQDVDFTASDASGTLINEWNWDFGDGNTGNGQITSHSYISVMDAIVELVVVNEFGCHDTVNSAIRVEDPTIGMIMDDDTTCTGAEMFFYGQGDADYTDWEWDFGDGNTAIGKNVSHIYTTAGNYAVELNVCSKTVDEPLVVNPQPTADAGSNEQLCQNHPFRFADANTPAIANDYETLQWLTNGAGSFDDPNLMHPVYTPAPGETGDITMTFIAYSQPSCDNDTSSMILHIDSLPLPDYTWLPFDSICVNEPVTFSGLNSTSSPITSWYWDFDDGSNDVVQNPTHIFTSAGLYDVKLIITNQEGCSDSITQQILVNPLPVAGFNVDQGTIVCAEIPLVFSGSSTTNIIDWQWDMGDGTLLSGQNVNHTYNSAGTYMVTLEVFNENSCTDTYTQAITVNELPLADFSMSPDDTNCVGEQVFFDATEISGGITNWDWNFADGATDNVQNTSHVYAAPGTYNVELIYTNGNGCKDTLIQPRRIELIDIDFIATESPSCEDHVVVFTGIDNNGNATFRDWEWDFGDGGTGTNKITSHTYTTPGTYDVTLSFCTESITIPIDINPQAIAVKGSDEATCEDLPFDLSTCAILPYAENYSSIEWFGGTGTFDDPGSLTPVYTPGATETGLVDLYMVAHGFEPCENDTAIMTLNVVEGAYAYAGSDENTCFGVPFDFNNASSVPFALNYDNLVWTTNGTGNFINDNAEVPVYVPGPSEVGPVVLTLTAWGNIVNCDSIDQVTLTVRPEHLVPDDFTLCYGDSLFAEGAWRYSSGTFYDTLTSIWGCDSVLQTNLTVHPKIDKDFTISTGDSICLGEISNFQQTGSAVLTGWFWDFGDGFTSTQANPTHEYTTPGTYDVWFYYDDNQGCNDSAMHRVTIFELPDVQIQPSLEVACENSMITYTGQSDQNITSWQWTFHDGSTAFGQNTSYYYTTAGDYMVTLTATAESGCTETDVFWMHVVPPPTADFTHELLVCENVQFTDQSTAYPGYNIVEWDWDFGDGTTSDLQDPQHSFPGGGNWDVTLTVTADSSGFFCYDSITHTVQIPNDPTVYFTWAPEPTCLGEETFFFGTSGNYIGEWYWEFGDGIHSTLQEPIHVYDAAGTYDVTLTVTDTNGCFNSLMHTVTVSDIPTADFTMSSGSGCIEELIEFTDQSSADVVSWYWSFGDGAFSYDQNPSHAYSGGGVYQVILTVTDAAGCTATDAQTVVIIDPPVADFTTLPNGCNTLDFTDLTSVPDGHAVVEWLWEFGDGTTSDLQNPSHTYSAPGFYDVILTATSDSAGFRCSDTIVKNVNVPIPPTITFSWSPEPTFLFDATSFFGNGSGIVDWQWDFGDGFSSNLQNPQHTYDAPAVYTVTLIGTNLHNCSDTVTHDITVVGIPDVDFSMENNPACVDEQIVFTGESSYQIAVWHWDFGDGSEGFGQNATHTYDTEGDYTVTLTVTDIWGVSSSASHVIQIRERPMAFFDFTEPTCANDSVYFTDLSVTEFGYIDRWVWDYGDGSVNDTVFHPGNPNVYHTFPMGGTYLVTLEVQSSLGCTESFSNEVTTLNSPIANFNAIGETCQNQVVQFEDASFANGSGNIIEWNWNFGDPLSGVDNTSTLQNPEHIFSTSDTFDVRLIIRNFNNCTDTVVKQVWVSPEPVADFSWDNSCQGQEVQFSIDTAATDNNIADWFWDFGDGLTSDLQEPVHVYEVSGTYTVTLFVENTVGCPAEISHDITVHPEPQANFDFTEPTCQNTEIQFIDLSSTGWGYVTQWVYDYGDGTFDTINYPDQPDPVHIYDTTGTFLVSLWILTSDSCEAFIEKEIFVTPAPLADFSSEGSCMDAPVEFTDLSVGAGGQPVNQWQWDFGDPLSGQNNFSQLQNPSHMFSQPGSYDVTLIVFNESTCSDTIIHQVEVKPLPDVDFIASEQGCFDQISEFYADSTLIDMDAVVIFAWDFGDGSPVVYQQNASHLYASTGEFEVTLTITDTAGCVNSMMRLHNVVEPPTASFDYANACQSDTTSFSDFSFAASNDDPIVEWMWDFGDPSSPSNTSTQQNPVHIYASTGDYDVTLRVTSQGGCEDSIIRSVSIYQRPLAGFTFTADPCQVGMVYFNDSSSAFSTSIEDYYWTFEPGFYSDVKNPDYDFQMGDTCLDVSLTVTDGRGCRDTVVKQVCIPAEIVIGFDYTASCFGETTDFSSFIESPLGDTLINFEWNFGEPESGQANISYLPDPSHTYLDDGTYSVTLRAMDQQGCWTEFTRQVTIFALPEADFSWESMVCDSTVYFDDMSLGGGAPIASWTWDFGDGSAPLVVTDPAAADVSHAYADAGTYQVMLITENSNGCQDTTIQEVFREYCIRAGLSVLDTLLCERFEIAFSDTSIYPDIITQWEWNFGDQSDTTYTSFAPVISHRYQQAGQYQVRLVVHSEQGGVPISDTMFKQLQVLPTPLPGFTVDAVCIGETSLFFDNTSFSGDLVQWLYDFGVEDISSDTSSNFSPQYTYSEADSFLVSMKVWAESGCYDSIMDTAVVNPLPQADFDWEMACATNPTLFNDLSDLPAGNLQGWQWYWDFGDTLTEMDISAQQNPQYQYDSVGTYRPKLTLTDPVGCMDTVSYLLQVHPSPVSGFSFRENFDNMQGQLQMVNESQEANSWEWFFDYYDGAGVDSEEENPVYQYEQDGLYEILLVSYNQFNCPDSSFFEYMFNFKGLFVPNAFSPNNPATDVREFRPKGMNLQTYYIGIYDRWGKLLWQSTKLDSSGSPAESWDGTVDGKELPMGTYHWKIRASFEDGSVWEGESIGNNEGGPLNTFGTVTLIR